MSSKTLSTGTLSLRFMQNAQRAKQQKEVELEKAHVEDDGQWEIAKEVRDSWGPASQTDNAVSYETSYLPFLFPSLSGPDTTSSTRPKGRRTFKKGKEVISQEVISQAEPESEPAASTSQSPSHPEATQTTKKGKKAAKSSLLSSDSNDRITKNIKSERPISKSNKIAKLAIFDTSGVGTDLRAAGATSVASTTTTATSTFMKPAGVDDPKSSSDQQIISSAREVKTKRVRRKSAAGTTEEVKTKKRKTAVE
ncbi:hypothetical protein D9758_001611 [Tetrapyrgos nigripes]|uniref:Uncharacterized protein n=1 Tax=Tetrapyrgos nigripes TaxID=182062 RepID=A0A8H5GXM7_9AGAR|nr:hypothetical protein D9758_001611 [Tetrapyrgos nigripes]